MSFLLEDNIPVPDKRRRKGQSYPFQEMQIGQSFALSYRDYSRVYTASRTFMHHNPEIKIIVRKAEDGGFRCWRVDPSEFA